MLSATAPSSSPHQHYFLSAVPSPLSPRSTNIYGGRYHQQSYHSPSTIESMATRDEITTTVAKPESSDSMFTFSAPPPPRREIPGQGLPFAQRRVKLAPPVARAGDLKEKRRGQFLRKVERGREEDRWEKRGDDILRMDWMHRQRAWEEAQARSAASQVLEDEMDEGEDQVPDTMDLPSFSSGGYSSQMQMSSQRSLASTAPPPPNDEEEIDRLLRDEDEELEMLLSYMPTSGDGPENRDAQRKQEGDDGDSLWSDDADYDELFSEVILSQEAQMQQSRQQQPDQGGDVEMDMT